MLPICEMQYPLYLFISLRRVALCTYVTYMPPKEAKRPIKNARRNLKIAWCVVKWVNLDAKTVLSPEVLSSTCSKSSGVSLLGRSAAIVSSADIFSRFGAG